MATDRLCFHPDVLFRPTTHLVRLEDERDQHLGGTTVVLPRLDYVVRTHEEHFEELVARELHRERLAVGRGDHRVAAHGACWA